MSKQAKILIILVALFILLAGYIIVTSRVIVLRPAADQTANYKEINKLNSIDQVGLLQREASYRQAIKNAIEKFDNVIYQLDSEKLADKAHSASSSQEEVATVDLLNTISQLKIGILGLRVPSDEYKPLHIDLVTALNKIRSYMESGDQLFKNEGIALVNQLKLDYPWVVE